VGHQNVGKKEMKPILLILSILFCCVCYATLEKPPSGFTVQILEPTGGNILRPNEWHYAETHKSENTLRWIISKEDTEGGKTGYETGVSLQVFVDVEPRTSKTPEQFVRDFIEGKKVAADKVHSTCEALDQGMFTRVCLEATEGDYRISYSCFWGNEIDVVAIFIAGAPLGLWKNHEDTFNIMNNFQLIDSSRFDKEASANKTVDTAPISAP